MKTAIIIAALAFIAIAATPAPSSTPDTLSGFLGIGGWPDFPQGIELDVQAATANEFTGTLNGDPIHATKVGDDYLLNPAGVQFNFTTPHEGTITIGANVYDISQ